MKKKLARIALVTAIIQLCVLLTPGLAHADVPLKDKYEHSGSVDFNYAQASKYLYYSSLLDKYDEYGYRPYSGAPLVYSIVQAQGETALELTDVEGKPAFLWDDSTPYIQWQVEVSVAGLYRLELDYYLPDGINTASARTLYLDGEIPFSEANQISFRGAWKDA